MKLNINGKMLTYVLSASLIIYIAAVGYISYELRDISSDNAEMIVESQVLNQTNRINKRLGYFFETVDFTVETLVETKTKNSFSGKELLTGVSSQILNGSSSIVSVWGYLEVSEVKENAEPQTNEGEVLMADEFLMGDDMLLSEDIQISDDMMMEGDFSMVEAEPVSSGPFALRLYKQNESVVEDTMLVVYDSSSYKECKDKMEFYIAPPYKKEDSLFYSKIVFPIVVDFEFAGVFGIEFQLDDINAIMNTIDSDEFYATILTEDGWVWYSNDEELIGRTADVYGDENRERVLIDSITSMDVFWADNELTGNSSLFMAKPLDVNGNKLKYVVSLPVEVVNASAKKTVIMTVIVGIIGLVAMSLFIFFVSKLITVPLVRTTKKLQKISQGELNVLGKSRNTLFEDEMSDISNSMSELVSSLESASVFANEIGEGNLNAEYKLVSREDALGISLLTMQQRLKQAKNEEDEKNIENEKRNWVTDGLAKFGEIIRENNDNMEKFCQNVLKNLLDYLGAAQGAMYVQAQKDLSDATTNKDFVLMSAQAYGKPVMMSGEVFSEQELTGRVLDENRIIIMDKLPDGYATLSPGMKDQKRPDNLIVVPMSINDDMYGIIEMLSYSKYEPHHIDFIEKVSENIASVISSVNVNINTAKLLEQSQMQADELSQHEEEMRQNLEEMQATQEEAQKRESKLLIHLSALNHNLISAQIDLKGRIIEISPLMSAKYNINIENIAGKYYDAIVTTDEKSKVDFSQLWNKVLDTGSGKRTHMIENRGKRYYFEETYMRIHQENTSARVLVVVEEKTKQEQLKELLKAEMDSSKDKE